MAWLCSQGWDAWGADIVERYLERGRPFFEERGLDADRLRLIAGPELPFDGDSFDIVLSDQVIEHVEDLGAFVRGIDRVSRHGSEGLHVFPATWRPVEPHLRTPFVHWLPKGRARRAAIRAAVSLNLTVPHFSDYSPTERSEIYSTFSETETFYRLRRSVAGAFQSMGFATDLSSVAREKVALRLPARVPAALHPAIAEVYGFAVQTYLRTLKHGNADAP